MNINFRPVGRLGNSLFQAAATFAHARKHGYNWGVQQNLREVPNLIKFFAKIPVLNGEFARYNRVDPSQFGYEEIPRFNNDTTLVGFFQSIKYFEHCQDEVKELFKLDIKPVDAVSIHVRRTDYVTYANSFPPITIEYLKQAIEYLKTKTTVYNIVVCSDDIQWCKDNLSKHIQGSNSGSHWYFSEGKTEFDDLSFMASCSHHVIANSTFSWWSAFLGHNPYKIIVSPDPSCWFGPGFTGTTPTDLIPESWHKIKFR